MGAGGCGPCFCNVQSTVPACLLIHQCKYDIDTLTKGANKSVNAPHQSHPTRPDAPKGSCAHIILSEGAEGEKGALNLSTSCLTRHPPFCKEKRKAGGEERKREMGNGKWERESRKCTRRQQPGGEMLVFHVFILFETVFRGLIQTAAGILASEGAIGD